jgi:hypothetical protein
MIADSASRIVVIDGGFRRGRYCPSAGPRSRPSAARRNRRCAYSSRGGAIAPHRLSFRTASYCILKKRSTMNAIFVAERGQTASIFFRFVIHHRFHYVNRRFDRISLTIAVMSFCDTINLSDWSAVPSEIKSNTLRRIGRFHG